LTVWRYNEIVPNKTLIVSTALNLCLDCEHGLASARGLCGCLNNLEVVIAVRKRLVATGTFAGVFDQIGPIE
jgi:hypothetical protein